MPVPPALLLAFALAFPSAALMAAPAPSPWSSVRDSHHAGDDDLLTAGLGLAGLRAPLPTLAADAEPDAATLRRRAIWANWRGIADVAPGGGLGEVYGDLSPVPGREFHAFARVPGARWPHRVMLQLPDRFDTASPCLVVAASSGSRGIYGAIAIAGGWGLPRGCAVAYTDKGAGTDWVDVATGGGTGLDGRPASAADASGFWVDADRGAPPTLAIKHAHSGDHPEADWGRHVAQAAAFGRERIAAAYGEAVAAKLVVIGLSVSNGGGALLRAAELAEAGLDGIVAVSPNVWAGEGGRALFDYGSDAALWMPCALAAPALFATLPQAEAWRQRCAALGSTPDAALARLRADGWTLPALRAGLVSVQLDLWRAVGAGYASAYLRRGPRDMPAGFRYATVDAAGQPIEAGALQRRLWWSDTAGIAPAPGVALLAADPTPAGELTAMHALRALWTGDGAEANQLKTAVAATRARLPQAAVPILLLHGLDDGLVPEAFSSGPYARWVQASGRPLRYWRIAHAQHFDNALGLPAMGAAYLPLLPYAWAAADAMHAHLREGAPLGADRDLAGQPRGVQDGLPPPLRREQLGL